MSLVDPQCRPKAGVSLQPVAVSSSGVVLPCCFISNVSHTRQLKEFLGDLYQQLDAKVYSYEQIANSEAMKAIEQSWTSGSFKPCVHWCPAGIDHVKARGVRSAFTLPRKKPKNHG